MTKPASSITLGSYQLLERIGEGGTAHVYRARREDGGLVAVKLLAPHAEADEPSARARLEREIEALGSVQHPGVLPLLDSGTDDEFGPYLVTPLVTGKSLRELLAGVSLPPEGGLLILWAMAGAAAALHRAGLVHRDLKPENTMVHPDGRLVLFDLGLAYRAGQTRYTDEGAVVGSVPYMAPEQVEGTQVSAAVDSWALGVIAYEAVVGARPFARDRTAEEAAAILVGSYPAPSAADRRVGPEYDAVVADCLASDPGARPSAADLRERASALVDWTDDHDGELAALVADPAGYQKRVTKLRVRRLAAEARAELAAGNHFAALRLIDRGLAYDPDNAELAELADADAPDHPPPKAMPEPPARLRWPWIAAGVTAMAVIVIAMVVNLRAGGRDDAPAPSPATPSAAAPTGDDKAMELVGDFIAVFKEGIEASEGADRRRALATANAPSPAAGASPLEGIAAIAAGDLSNDDAAGEVDLAAGEGEALVPPAILGGADPAKTVADFDRRAARAPADAELAVARALVYLAAGRTGAGLEQLDALVSAHPGSAAVWAARGFVELRRGNWAEAEVALGRAIELDPRDAQSLRNRGILRSRLGRTRDAYLDLTRALAIAPGDGDALRELAVVYRRAGRADAATELERRAK